MKGLATDRRFRRWSPGTAASVVSTVGLALLAQREGKSAFQPMNATNHWLHRDRAALQHGVDAAHTLIGYATHYASAFFWALPFEAWLAIRPPRTAGGPLREACVMSAIAAAIGYGATPKRLKPALGAGAVQALGRFPRGSLIARIAPYRGNERPERFGRIVQLGYRQQGNRAQRIFGVHNMGSERQGSLPPRWIRRRCQQQPEHATHAMRLI